MDLCFETVVLSEYLVTCPNRASISARWSSVSWLQFINNNRDRSRDGQVRSWRRRDTVLFFRGANFLAEKAVSLFLWLTMRDSL